MAKEPKLYDPNAVFEESLKTPEGSVNQINYNRRPLATGVPFVDMANGQLIPLPNSGGKRAFWGGLHSMMTLCGKIGCGKSTLACLISGSSAYHNPGTRVLYICPESGLTIQRAVDVCSTVAGRTAATEMFGDIFREDSIGVLAESGDPLQWFSDGRKITILESSTYTVEDIGALLNRIYVLRMKSIGCKMSEAGRISQVPNISNEELTRRLDALHPFIVVVDPISAVSPDTVDDTKRGISRERARALNAELEFMGTKLMTAGIHLILVAHTMDGQKEQRGKTLINTPAPLKGMSAGTKVLGGSGVSRYSGFTFDMSPLGEIGKNGSTENKTLFGADTPEGYLIRMRTYKSRYCPDGFVFTGVYTSASGYSPGLTAWLYLVSVGGFEIVASGKYRIPNCGEVSDIILTRNNIVENLRNPKVMKALVDRFILVRDDEIQGQLETELISKEILLDSAIRVVRTKAGYDYMIELFGLKDQLAADTLAEGWQKTGEFLKKNPDYCLPGAMQEESITFYGNSTY